MKKIVYIFAKYILMSNYIFAQKNVRTGLSLELGGKAVYYSLNHEFFIPYKKNIQLLSSYGIGYLQENSYKNLAIPLYFGFLIGNTHSIELGTGFTYNYYLDRKNALYYLTKDNKYKEDIDNHQFNLSLWLGYRFQASEKIYIKVGICPIYNLYHLRNSKDVSGEYRTQRVESNRGIGLKNNSLLLWAGIGIGFKF